MSVINFQNIRQSEALMDAIQEVKHRIEGRINARRYATAQKPVALSGNKALRLCLLAGLSAKEPRELDDVEQLALSKNNNRFFETLFTLHNLSILYSALLKLRYHDLAVDWDNLALKSKIINTEILRGNRLLLHNGTLDEWLMNTYAGARTGRAGAIPVLNLDVGAYEDDIPATLNLNGKDVANTQILVAGTTGSGKSNLLAVLINGLRSLSVDSPYPVNFLLFDYKGEFSRPGQQRLA